MESFHVFNSDDKNYQNSYNFNSADLADIPCPDDNCAEAEGSSVGDDIELPLPPGTSRDEFLIPLPPKQEPFQISNSLSPLSQNNPSGNISNHLLMAENSFRPSGFNVENQQFKVDQKIEEEEIENKPTEYSDDNKYSPSKADSDEENQDLVNLKPKVLGKEQAKKRLMAFSLSKQPSSSVKKQNKAISSTRNKEKPPNPNKGSNVQEQFRATISAIEEEKKKMFQNMPSYLLLEMSELTKSHSSMSSSLQLLEKLKHESRNSKGKQTSSKDGNVSSLKVKNRRSFHRNGSRSPRNGQSNSRKRRRSRSKRRSRSRNKRSHSRSRRKSHGKSQISRRCREEKNSKSEKESVSKKKFEDWKGFKASGLVLESDSRQSKSRYDETKPRRDEHQRRSRSPNDRTDFKPIFNYLTKGCSFMTSFRAKPADLSSSAPVLFLGKMIKYTQTKPFICWAENPNYAKEYYMSRQMLLENCDQNTSSILFSIIENKKETTLPKENIMEIKPSKSRLWYPRDDYLVPDLLNTYDSLGTNDSRFIMKLETDRRRVEENQANVSEMNKEVNSDQENVEKVKASLDGAISLVNDDYLSDEEQKKGKIEVKVQPDLNLNSVKIRSKWDSDYEGEKLADSAEKRKSGSLGLASQVEPLSLDASDATNLVSEYEEFLKMVSVDSNDDRNNHKEEIVAESQQKIEKIKMKFEKSKESEENPKILNSKLGMTDWDQESDHEEKSVCKKIQFSEFHNEFSILGKNEELDVKLEKNKKKLSKKKIEKVLLKKKKSLKKCSKGKKKKRDNSLSEESTSESYESDSESDSNESEPSKKKKRKKKISKSKKKSKNNSSSESNSDSAEDKAKKKKYKKKKGASKMSSSSDDDSGDSEEIEKSLLKQLDFKKQLIMKKIEEIDFIGDKNIKKKEKESRKKKKEKESSHESDFEKQIKSVKKKKIESKTDKKKFRNSSKKGKVLGKGKKLKKSKSSSDSSESDKESVKEKKTKKLGKRKRNASESSETDGKKVKVKSKSSKKTSKKIKNTKKSSSSSDSDDSENSLKGKKKPNKKDKKLKIGEKIDSELGFKQNLFDESSIKGEEPPGSGSGKSFKKVDKRIKNKKENGDWEASSSDEESVEEGKTESSWDDVSIRESKIHESEDSLSKFDKQNSTVVPIKDRIENNSTNTYETNNQFASEALKTSLSNFSFNENSFCSFGQELSRDFFLTERTYSNSGNLISNDNVKIPAIEPRPFQSVNKDSDARKPADSELYSPGYSDSELSEAEISNAQKVNSNTENLSKEDVYDPLNCDSEGSAENNEIELSSIPLPRVSEILLPGEPRNFENVTCASSLNSDGEVLKDLTHKETEFSAKQMHLSPMKSCFTMRDFTPVKASQSTFNDDKNTPTKRQLMSVKGQQKLVSKAASVFQDESDEENIEPSGKVKTLENTQTQASTDFKEKTLNINLMQIKEKHYFLEEKDEIKERKKESRDTSIEKENRRRSKSRERNSSKTCSKRSSSPRKRRKSRTPEAKREKREIRSDSFEIEPLKSAMDPSGLSHLEQPIPVLTGLDTSSSEGFWSKPLASGNELSNMTDNLIAHSQSFDIYPSDESKFRNRNYDKEYLSHDRISVEKSKNVKSKKDKRKSRSRSYSPKKKPRSKSPEKRKSPRNRSPRRKSVSPKRRDKSPFSPRRRSPKRKSPSRGYKNSRSPEKRRKSPSRSPRKGRGSSTRRSRSVSPRKYRSPKHRNESPRRKDSPANIRSCSSDDRFSPKKEMNCSQPYPVGLQNRIPVIGATNDGVDMKLSPSALRPTYEGFRRLMPDPSVAESGIYSSFYEGDYTEEFGVSGYTEEVGVNNLITVKNHDIEKVNSPERLSLDQRIELELGVPVSGPQTQNDQYQIPNQVCPPFQEINQSHFQNSYNCDNTSVSNDSFYQNQNVQINSDFNGQYFSSHQQQPPPSYGPFQQYSSSQPVQNSVLQVGNIVEVVPTLQHPPPISSLPSSLRPKAPQIMQVGNVLQVVPSQKTVPPMPQSVSHGYGLPNDSPMLKTQKATAVVAPSSIVPTPNPEVLLNPLIRAIQLEREKRRKEKEKRKAEREARRKARQLRREAKLMSVNEKLKKSVQNEGLMLGQEVEDDELLDGLDVPSPPIPVEIITVSSPSALPPAGKGILITAGFIPKPPSEKKEVKFADGVCPGEGTSTSGGEDVASPPPKPKLPKEKRFKKKKTKVKKKVKVQIIRQIIQEEDDDEDDLSPPPPPPGDPPPVFFARFPFAGDAQFPVYHTQTTTTTLTTVQYPTPSFE